MSLEAVAPDNVLVLACLDLGSEACENKKCYFILFVTVYACGLLSKGLGCNGFYADGFLALDWSLGSGGRSAYALAKVTCLYILNTKYIYNYCYNKTNE